MKYLKNSIIPGIIVLLMGTSMTTLGQVPYLDEGEKVKEYPAVTWIKGEPVTTFDKDKIYVIELWATWCIPCLAAMPHLNALNAKFKDKIVFIGQDVLESKNDKVIDIVNKKGAEVNYRVAVNGDTGSDFDKKWTKPSGTFGIPRTFVIQDNTIVWITEPFSLSEEILQLLVDKKFTKEKAINLIKKEK